MVGRDMFAGQPYGKNFQGCPDLEDVFQILHTEPLDQDTPLGNILDPAFFLQLQCSPADRRAADLKFRGQRAFAEHLAIDVGLIEKPLFHRTVDLHL